MVTADDLASIRYQGQAVYRYYDNVCQSAHTMNNEYTEHYEEYVQGPILLTRFNFNPNMDK